MQRPRRPLRTRHPRTLAGHATLVALAVAAALTGCSSDDGGASGPSTDGSGVTATSTATTATPTTAAPTTTTVVQVPRPTGREAIDALLAAWRGGDRAGALTVADPTQVDLLFAVPPEPGEDRGCNQGGANPATQCVFRLSSGELQVRASPRAGGFIVDFVFLARS